MKDIAILSENFDEVDLRENIFSKLDSDDNHIILYTIKDISEEDVKRLSDGFKFKFSFSTFPESCNTTSKRHNHILKYSLGKCDYLHIIKDSIRIKKDPSIFLSEIESMIDVFNLDSWFNTSTDVMNYVYQKYMYRVKIPIDVKEFRDLGLDTLVFTSHANNNWTCYKMKNRTEETLNEILFDENFSIPMFFIIEYLARRRNTNKNSINLMNMYPSVLSEVGVFEVDNKFEIQPDKEALINEDILFKSMNVNFAPDNSIDRVLEMTYEILKSKIVK